MLCFGFAFLLPSLRDPSTIVRRGLASVEGAAPCGAGALWHKCIPIFLEACMSCPFQFVATDCETHAHVSAAWGRFSLEISLSALCAPAASAGVPACGHSPHGTAPRPQSQLQPTAGQRRPVVGPAAGAAPRGARPEERETPQVCKPDEMQGAMMHTCSKVQPGFFTTVGMAPAHGGKWTPAHAVVENPKLLCSPTRRSNHPFRLLCCGASIGMLQTRCGLTQYDCASCRRHDDSPGRNGRLYGGSRHRSPDARQGGGSPPRRHRSSERRHDGGREEGRPRGGSSERGNPPLPPAERVRDWDREKLPPPPEDGKPSKRCVLLSAL